MPNAFNGLLADPRGEMRATPRNKLMGLLADVLSGANDYAQRPDAALPGGKANPVLGLLADGLGLNSLATTAQRASYGEPLTNGMRGSKAWLKPETADVAMMAPISPRNALAALGMVGGMADTGAVRAAGLLGKVQNAPVKKALEYGIEHRPMTVDGGASLLHDLETSFGPDIYTGNALQYFGSGDKRERAALKVMNSVRGKPDAMVTIYRGVPDDVSGINPGDWVTLDPGAAADYGKVLKMQVPASHITSWPDSLLEFGYHPPSKP